MAAAVWLSTRAVHLLIGVSTFSRLVDLAVSIPFGLAVVYFACRAMKVEELEMAVRAFGGPISRRFGASGDGPEAG
jgi:hypothetical protein